MSLFANLPPTVAGKEKGADEKRGSDVEDSVNNILGVRGEGDDLNRPKNESVVGISSCVSTENPNVFSPFTIKTTRSFLPSSVMRSRKKSRTLSKSSRKSRTASRWGLKTPKSRTNPSETIKLGEKTPVVESNVFAPKSEDDYDPANPNDYEAFCKARIARRRAQEVDRRLACQIKEADRERKEREKLAKDRVLKGVVSERANISVGRGRGRNMTLPAWMKTQ